MIDDLMSYIPRCIRESEPEDMTTKSLAMAYVPFQKWQKLYSPEVAFKRGTLFSELDKPFIGEEAISDD